MGRLSIFRSTTATSAARFSSGLHPIATITGLRADSEDLVTTAVTASAGSSSLHRVSRPRNQPLNTRRLLWFAVQPALSVGGIVATAESFPKPVAVSGSNPTADAPAPQEAEEQAAPGQPAPEHATPERVTPEEPAETPSPAVPPAKPPSAISRVELTIDSLRTYDLVRPIPVVVESLGERNYVAEMPDLNITTTASNPSEIIITLKDRIAQVYDGLRILKHLDAEQSRQLKVLESYIAKTRRGWLDRR
jgi:hypothetical protein